MKHVIRVTLAVLLMTMLPGVLRAQNNRAWSVPYEKAQDAFKAGRYQEAIPLLETAVKANAKAEPNKRTDGVYSTDYYPYYYLGIAYFETGNYRKAQENFEKAKSPLPRDKAMVAKLNDYAQKTQVAVNAASSSPPSQPPPSPSPSQSPAVARGPEPEPARPAAVEARRDSTPSVAAAPSRAPAFAPPPSPPPANIPPASNDTKKSPESPASSDALKSSLRAALRALFEGDVQASISMLEPMAAQRGSAADMATLHAYLGVAYATRALSSKTLDEGSRWNSTAVEQFKLAVAAQATFQLSSRMVSPKILSMFNQARR